MKPPSIVQPAVDAAITAILSDIARGEPRVVTLDCIELQRSPNSVGQAMYMAIRDHPQLNGNWAVARGASSVTVTPKRHFLAKFSQEARTLQSNGLFVLTVELTEQVAAALVVLMHHSVIRGVELPGHTDADALREAFPIFPNSKIRIQPTGNALVLFPYET